MIIIWWVAQCFCCSSLDVSYILENNDCETLLHLNLRSPVSFPERDFFFLQWEVIASLLTSFWTWNGCAFVLVWFHGAYWSEWAAYSLTLFDAVCDCCHLSVSRVYVFDKNWLSLNTTVLQSRYIQQHEHFTFDLTLLSLLVIVWKWRWCHKLCKQCIIWCCVSCCAHGGSVSVCAAAWSAARPVRFIHNVIKKYCSSFTWIRMVWLLTTEDIMSGALSDAMFSVIILFDTICWKIFGPSEGLGPTVTTENKCYNYLVLISSPLDEHSQSYTFPIIPTFSSIIRVIQQVTTYFSWSVNINWSCIFRYVG